MGSQDLPEAKPEKQRTSSESQTGGPDIWAKTREETFGMPERFEWRAGKNSSGTSETYVQYAGRELGEILKETGPEKEKHLMQWLNAQVHATKAGFAAAGDLPHAERVQLLRLSQSASVELLKIEAGKQDLDGLKEVLSRQTQLDYNLDHPTSKDPEIGQALLGDTLLLAAIQYTRGHKGDARMCVEQAANVQVRHGWAEGFDDARAADMEEVRTQYLPLLWQMMGYSGKLPDVD